MIDWQTVIAHPAVLTVGWAVLHAFWLGALLAGGLWLALRVMPDRPGARYGACATALFMIPVMLCVVLILHRPWISVGGKPVDQSAATPSVDNGTAMQVYVLRAQPGGGSDDAASRRIGSESPPVSESASAAAPSGNGAGWLRRGLPYAGVLYAVGLLVMVMRLLCGWWLSVRLRSVGLRPLPASIARIAEDARRSSGVRRAVRFAMSSRAAVPCVVGVLRPVVLLPVSVATGLTPIQISSILAHELAHVRRHDVLVNLSQVLIETLLFFHPAVWWVGKQLRAEREYCCDDDAVATVGSRLDYAEAIAAVAGLQIGRPSLSLAATDGGLPGRVRRLLLPGSTAQDRSSVWGAGLLVVLMLAVAVVTAACSDGAGQGEGDRGGSEPEQTPAEQSDLDAEPPLVAPSVPENQARVLKIDWQALKNGDMRFNVVIRPGDVINVVNPNPGFVYISGGPINRPGAYTVPGENELSLRRLIASAGRADAFEQGDEPIYVDVIRTLPNSEEQRVYHLNFTDIANGDASDIYLWSNDIIDIGVEPRPEDLFVGPEPDESGYRPIIDESWEQAATEDVVFSPIIEADLVVDPSPRVIGPGDTVRVAIYELRMPGVDDVQDRRIGEDGELRLAVVGVIQAAGMTEAQLQQAIIDKLERDGIMRQATVGAQLIQSANQIYIVVAPDTRTGVRSGSYLIPKPNLRLIEAIVIAGGVPDRTQYMYVIRNGNREVPGVLVPMETGPGAGEQGAGVSSQ